MLRRVVVLTFALGLCACAGRAPRLASERVATTPRPADGLWAILDPGCPKPSLASIGAWPKCASPFWISRGSALVVHTVAMPSGKALNHSYRAFFSLTGADPVIATVGDEKDGYLFLALTELARDDKGRLIGATGAAVACPGPADGAIRLTPTDGGCETASPDGVRKAAKATLQDQSVLSRVAWIAAGAPSY